LAVRAAVICADYDWSRASLRRGLGLFVEASEAPRRAVVALRLFLLVPAGVHRIVRAVAHCLAQAEAVGEDG